MKMKVNMMNMFGLLINAHGSASIYQMEVQKLDDVHKNMMKKIRYAILNDIDDLNHQYRTSGRKCHY